MPLQARDPQLVWSEVRAHLRRSYCRPDIEAFHLAVCGMVNHYTGTGQPFWNLTLGRQGSGKTEILAHAFTDLDDARIINEITPAAMMSARDTGDRENSLLLWRNRQIWILPDMSGIARMHPQQRDALFARWRHIFDGTLNIATGNGFITWDGRVAMFALGTPEIETVYALQAHMGNRFVVVRWRSRDIEPDLGDYVRGQEHRGPAIRATTRRLTTELINGHWSIEIELDNADPRVKQSDAACRLVAWLRRVPLRDPYDSRRRIVVTPDAESPSRLITAVSQIVRANMNLFHRVEPTPGDFHLAERLMLDTIPSDFRKILNHIAPEQRVSYAEIQRKTDIPETTVDRRIGELVEIGVLTKPTTTKPKYTALTDKFVSALAETGLTLTLNLPNTPGKGRVVSFPEPQSEALEEDDLSDTV